MLAEQFLDLGRIAVGSAGDVHIFLAVGDLQIAVRIEYADVAGVQPTVLVDRGFGSGRIIQISLHDAVAAHEYFTLSSRRHRTTVVIDTLECETGNDTAA